MDSGLANGIASVDEKNPFPRVLLSSSREPPTTLMFHLARRSGFLEVSGRAVGMRTNAEKLVFCQFSLTKEVAGHKI